MPWPVQLFAVTVAVRLLQVLRVRLVLLVLPELPEPLALRQPVLPGARRVLLPGAQEALLAAQAAVLVAPRVGPAAMQAALPLQLVLGVEQKHPRFAYWPALQQLSRRQKQLRQRRRQCRSPFHHQPGNRWCQKCRP